RRWLRFTSFIVENLLAGPREPTGEVAGAPRRKLSAGARTVPTLRGHGPGGPSCRRASFSVPEDRKISAERSRPAIAVGIAHLWVMSSRHRGDMGLSTYRQLIIPLTNPRDFLALPPVADFGTSDDSASELVGIHAVRRGLRCCLSLWRTPAWCARVPPRSERR